MRTRSRIQAGLPQAGAVASALGAAGAVLCCLPFATGIAGAAVAAAGARLSPFRPWLAVVSLALLAWSFRTAYGAGAAGCEAGSCGAGRSQRGQRLVLWLVTALVLALLGVSWWADRLIYWML